MVIRKPYAFLIKHFKKIHIALLIFCIYIYYKIVSTNSFVSEFLNLGAYDASIESITKYISVFLLLIVFLSAAGNILLVLLLRHKGKPWKLYLIPTVQYIVLFFALMWTRSFFYYYDGTQSGMDIRMVRDIMFIATIAQFLILLIYIMRILGLDLNKFNFKMDEEYLELTKDDKEELEININIDYHAIIRLFNKTKRYLRYFYLEHKTICNIVGIILAFIFLKNAYTFIFVTHKSYHQGDVYKANGYEIVINNAYYTTRDKKGDVIEDGRAFVIVDVSITNKWEKRKIDLNKFHIVSGKNNYGQTSKVYTSYFDDLGKTTDYLQELKTNEKLNTLLIYNIDLPQKIKKDNPRKYTLYYQEINDLNDTNLRKIKLDIKDLSTLNKMKKLESPEVLPIKTKTINEEIVLEDGIVKDAIRFSVQTCKVKNDCSVNKELLEKEDGYKILEIPFESKRFSGKELIDFSSNYGKIKYKDREGKEKTIEIKSAVRKMYFGKYLYLKVPEEIVNLEKIELIYTVRNDQYSYSLPIEGDDYE